MKIDFFIPSCQSYTDNKVFGICDDPHPSQNPAYIDEHNGTKWIAIVENNDRIPVTFTAIDNCIKILRADNKMEKRCDGMLTFNSTVIFLELKQRSKIGNSWVKDAVKQLISTISSFESTVDSNDYIIKKAYIANSEHPKFKSSQMERMEKFYNDAGYILRIEARIVL